MYDLIIIGAGPAGLTAALYSGRFRLQTLILEQMAPGGQIILSSTIENFPGFPGGIPTAELIERMQKQIEELGIGIETEEVNKIKAESLPKETFFEIITPNKNYQAKAVIVAVGAQPKRLGLESEARLIGRGISYCATCDAPLFRDKEVVVVGAGDKAIEEAIFLSSYAKKVTVIHRRNQLRASGILQEKAKTNPKINFVLESAVEDIKGKDKVEAAVIKNLSTGAMTNLICQGIFIFVGIKPDTDFLKDLLKLDELGFIMTDQEFKTSLNGIFACGDCCKKSLYQVVTACSEGAIAATSAHNYLGYRKV